MKAGHEHSMWMLLTGSDGALVLLGFVPPILYTALTGSDGALVLLGSVPPILYTVSNRLRRCVSAARLRK
jgi:hypothetical protein